MTTWIVKKLVNECIEEEEDIVATMITENKLDNPYFGINRSIENCTLSKYLKINEWWSK